MKNRLAASLLLLAILFFVWGCKPSTSENKPQRDLALKVTDYIGTYLANKNYSYKYQILCKNSVEELTSPEHPQEKSQAVPKVVRDTISDYSKNGCSPAITNLASFFELLDTSLEGDQVDNIVLIIQFPWGSGNDTDINALAKRLSKIKKTEKIKKVLLFGSHGNTGKTREIFNHLSKVLNSEGNDNKAVELAIKQLATEIKKDSNSNKQLVTDTTKDPNYKNKEYTILTLFIPAEGK